MICSMTAYAKREIKNNWGSAIWEIRSVNHRYLEVCFRIPEQFRNLESIFRECVHSRLTRGRVECNLQFELFNDTKEELILNKKLAKQLLNAANWIKIQSNEGEINPIDILRWPGVLSIEDKDPNDNIAIEILSVLNSALDDLIISRKIEGQALKKTIEQYLEGVSEEVTKIRARIPEVLRWQRERLITKLKEVEIRLENNRLEQELVLMAQRADVSEELDRLEVHIKETFNVLKKKEAIGRRLDFMMQEFNRESNTLASKSINIEITNSAIELKVLIEQMREQIQNIE